jgi:hypothetical protein
MHINGNREKSNYDRAHLSFLYTFYWKKSLFIVPIAIVLQILDFGLARVLSNGIQTGYVSTR